MRDRTLITATGIVALAACLVVFAVIRNRPRYPFGWSHCCDKMIALELLNYAEKHDGWFPRGAATPEASFSLLYEQQPEIGSHLAGKAVVIQDALDLLENGKPLTPKTCGWQYIEGLRQDDPSELALFWDKAKLGHNGEELQEAGRFVGFVTGKVEFIPDSGWSTFLANQLALQRALGRPVAGMHSE